nr:partitioning defective protein 6 [Leptinotarsa decemlineata]
MNKMLTLEFLPKEIFEAEYRRFSIESNTQQTFEEFRSLIERLHFLKDIPFLISYIDPSDQDLLPINNDDNLKRALINAKPLLKLIIQRKGNSFEELNGYGTLKPRNLISTILGSTPARAKTLPISNPHDFRQVSQIIDVDIVPETCRRVRLLKHGSDKPLGFYIRDGTSVKVTQNGEYLYLMTWIKSKNKFFLWIVVVPNDDDISLLQRD